MKTVFYFTTEWCQPCKKVKPIVEDMKKEGFQFQMIDADYEQLLVKRFEIKSVPTFILLEDGKEINRITGAKTRYELEEFIKNER
jgi:thioredoxin-like negative regulator of GroEL